MNRHNIAQKLHAVKSPEISPREWSQQQMSQIDVTEVFKRAPGEWLVACWYEEGEQAAALQVSKVEPAVLEGILYKFPGKPRRMILTRDGRFLVDDRKFRVTLQVANVKEMESIERLHRSRWPDYPLPDEHLLIRYSDVEEGALTSAVAIVTAQKIAFMEVDLHYYSVKQRKVVTDPATLEPLSKTEWTDTEAGQCALERIDAKTFAQMLETDRILQLKTAKPSKTPPEASKTSQKRPQSVPKLVRALKPAPRPAKAPTKRKPSPKPPSKPSKKAKRT